MFAELICGLVFYRIFKRFFFDDDADFDLDSSRFIALTAVAKRFHLLILRIELSSFLLMSNCVGIDWRSCMQGAKFTLGSKFQTLILPLAKTLILFSSLISNSLSLLCISCAYY